MVEGHTAIAAFAGRNVYAGRVEEFKFGVHMERLLIVSNVIEIRGESCDGVMGICGPYMAMMQVTKTSIVVIMVESD